MPPRKASAAVGAPAPAPFVDTFDAQMAIEQERVATFKRAGATAGDRSVEWPHPTSGKGKDAAFATPDAFARVGLFFHAEASSSSSSSASSSRRGGAEQQSQANDVVQHYICGTRIAGWSAGDDPLARLREASPQCPTVLLLDSRDRQLEREAWSKAREPGVAQWAAEDAHLLPTSEEMVRARRATFGDSWPYDRKKGWKPTSQKVRADR